MPASVLPRHVSGEIDAALGGARVILIHGARQTGKTTLARQVLQSIGRHIRHARRSGTAGGGPWRPGRIRRAARDRWWSTRSSGPATPLVVAIKMAVDRDPAPGRFIITGSTNFLTVPTVSESLAGRLAIIDLWPFSAGELARGPAENFVSLAFDDPGALRAGPRGTRSRGQYFEMICAGGYPAAVVDAGPATALVPRLRSHRRSARHRGACRHPSSRRRGTGAGDGCCVDWSGTERGSPGARRRRQRPHRRELPRLAPHCVLGAPSADVVPQLVHEGREIRQAVSRRHRPCRPTSPTRTRRRWPVPPTLLSADLSRHSWPARWPNSSHGTTRERNSATTETTAAPRSISSSRAPTGVSWPSRQGRRVGTDSVRWLAWLRDRLDRQATTSPTATCCTRAPSGSASATGSPFCPWKHSGTPPPQRKPREPSVRRPTPASPGCAWAR